MSSTHGLLALVALMAVACGLALWSTLEQTRELKQPTQHGELWHVANVNSELARVLLMAQQVQARQASVDELRVRLDVLSSVLDSTRELPQVRQRLQARVPAAVATLDDLAGTVGEWSRLLDQDRSDNGLRAARRIQAQEALLSRARQAMADVHVAGSDDDDSDRLALHQRFLLLSAVLAGLLVGTAALIWQLGKDIRRARANTQALAQTNQQLEARVLERTRKIEEGRLVLNFILNASPSEVLLIDAKDNTVIFVNQRLLSRLGLQRPPETLPLQRLFPDAGQAQSLVDGLERYGEVVSAEALMGHKPPSWSSLSARLIEVDGRLAYLLWSYDISAHKHLEGQLRELATTDALTGLNNRRSFLDKGATLLEHCRRHHQPCAVLMLDIDHFKSINDRFGHQAGDEALIACAQALRDTLRESDVVGRLGGEEFGALLPLADGQAAQDTAERVRLAVQQLKPSAGDGQLLDFTCSIGVARLDGRDLSLEALIAEADQALYRAKALGRNRVVPHLPHSPLD
jgi:diguanylate cyclase (GGDEF)-like protein